MAGKKKNEEKDLSKYLEQILRTVRKSRQYPHCRYVKGISFFITVMIRFSARGAYLLLAPQRRALIRDRALI